MGFGDVKTPTYVSVEKDTAHFSIKRQNQEPFHVQSVSGFLVGIDFLNGKYEGKDAPKLLCKFIDHESHEEFMFQTSFMGTYAQTIMNSLASVEHDEIGVVGLKLSEKDGKTRMQVYHNGMYMNWKYKPEEMPVAEEIVNKSGQILGKDYTERTNFFKETVLPQVQMRLPSIFQRRALVESHTERQRVLPSASVANDDIQWARPPVAALPERSSNADYVPFPTSTGNVNVPRSTSRVIEAEVVPFPTDDDLPF